MIQIVVGCGFVVYGLGIGLIVSERQGLEAYSVKHWFVDAVESQFALPEYALDGWLVIGSLSGTRDIARFFRKALTER